MTTAPVEQSLGQVGRYRLQRQLGVGGMAEVFKAQASGPGGFERTLVVKRILPERCEDPEFVRMFVAEAKILGMLHHPNVVQAYDFGDDGGTLFLVLEYVDGPSVGRILRGLRSSNQSMPIAIAAHFGHEVARALEYVHNLKGSDGEPLNVIHRDVTPSNIVVTSSGTTKLLDFGIARYETSDAATDHHSVKGKPAYLAPEILEGKKIDARVDLFALGVVVYEMLTSKPLFGSDHELVTLRKVVSMPIEPPSRLRPEVPATLDAIVMKALERDPDKRYQSAAEMARDLNEFVVASALRADELKSFVGDMVKLLAQPRVSLATILAASADTLPAPNRPRENAEEREHAEPKDAPARRPPLARLRDLFLGRNRQGTQEPQEPKEPKDPK
jgi:serine/threonine-protein kinase